MAFLVVALFVIGRPIRHQHTCPNFRVQKPACANRIVEEFMNKPADLAKWPGPTNQGELPAAPMRTNEESRAGQSG